MASIPEIMKIQACRANSSVKRSFPYCKELIVFWLKNVSVIKKIIFLTFPALVLTLLIYGLTAILEPDYEQKCNQYTDRSNYLACKITNSRILGQVQNFSILLALSIFILDVRERRKQSERLAWQLIDAARGAETSGTRIQALEELNEVGASLRGLDADGADLIRINLRKADLSQSSLRGAFLQEADLYRANLYKAKLQKANLRGANLQGADLWGANLEEAILQEGEPDLDGKDVRLDERVTNLRDARLGRANLRKAILHNADLSGTDLREAFLQGADLRGACLKGANLYGTHFGDAQITMEQLQLAQNDSWKQARYDIKFCQRYPELNLLQDISVNEPIETKLLEPTPELKLLGVVHTLLTVKEIDRSQEIAEIRHKIIELIQLLDAGSAFPLHNHRLVDELTASVERLAKNGDQSNDSYACNSVARDSLLDVKNALREQAEAYKYADEIEQHAKACEQQAEEKKKPYREAGEWFGKNQEYIKKKVVELYFEYRSNKSEINSGVVSVEELRIIEEDVSACLERLSFCLCIPQKPGFDSVILNKSFLFSARILEVVLRQIVPEIIMQSPESLSAEALGRLNKFIVSSIDELEKLHKNSTLKRT